MNLKKLYSTFFLPLFIGLLAMTVVTGCSDDDEELQVAQYGYVQFKLHKSNTTDAGTRATDRLEKLADAQKIKVVLLHGNTTVSQTLVLNSYNATNAEFGLRSDKLQLLAEYLYKMVGYCLYDKLDEVLLAGSAGDDNVITVVNRGLQEKVLEVNAVARGMVNFKLTKEGLSQTRAENNEYLFSNIRVIDVDVTNIFTRETTTFKDMKVKYSEGSVENEDPTDSDNKYMDTGIAICDSAVWLPSGAYQVTAYTTYSKVGAVKKELGSAVMRGELFTISDNALTENAVVPIKLAETAEYIKDYKALKEIWEKLGGPAWSFHGIGLPEGCNWNFNKELDMWGKQPGVTLDDKGRVTGLTLEGFGARGRVPDAIGQLTELEVLALGTHGEVVDDRVFTEEVLKGNASKQDTRMHYKKLFLDYDERLELSEMLQDGINANEQMKKIAKNSRIQLKDTQVGNLCNRITFVSPAIMRLTKLQQFYIANAPVTADDICPVDASGNLVWEDATSEYARQYATEALSWENLKELTDVEVYNCPNVTTLPKFLYELPEMQLLNIACNRGISADQLRTDWANLADAPVGKKLQILYMGYNNLEEFPETKHLEKMENLGMLDCIFNKVHTVHAFTEKVQLASLLLNNNRITEIPRGFCKFTDQVENLDFSHNKLKYIPNIFDAKSVYVMGSVNFSYNEIGSEGGYNLAPEDRAEGEYKGINASSVALAFNQISKFPTELFKAGSPITTINLSNNVMTKIPRYSLRPEGDHRQV